MSSKWLIGRIYIFPSRQLLIEPDFLHQPLHYVLYFMYNIIYAKNHCTTLYKLLSDRECRARTFEPIWWFPIKSRCIVISNIYNKMYNIIWYMYNNIIYMYFLTPQLLIRPDLLHHPPCRKTSHVQKGSLSCKILIYIYMKYTLYTHAYSWVYNVCISMHSNKYEH